MAQRWVLIGLGLGLVACADGSTDTGDLPPAITSGTVKANEFDREASAETFKAFGFATNGFGLIYLAANPDATCATVTSYLSATREHDPSGVLMAGHCSLIFDFKYSQADGFEGEYNSQSVGSIWNVNCAMSEGEWELSGSGRERDYFYTGDWWQGNAQEYTATLTAKDDNTPNVTLSIGPALAGQFIYEDTIPDPATGTITGTVDVERCQALVQTPIFGE